MPYCCRCGKQVEATDRFCASCGSPQPGAAPRGTVAPDPFAGITPKSASLLCYIPWIGWIWAVIVIASQRFRHEAEARFHAFQGLYLFVAWLIIDWVISPALLFSGMDVERAVPRAMAGVLHLLVLAAWIVMLIKVSHGEHYRLPVIGELADRSVHEQHT
jgi:uncharacterized membrane protein